MSRHLLVVIAVGAVAVMGLSGCGSQGAPPRAMANLPARGYHPGHFPDIPLAPTFALKPERDQLAIAAGGGLIRRFDVGLVQRLQAKAQTPAEILEWYGKMLPEFGWTLLRSDTGKLSFRRERSPEVAEVLHVQSGVSGGMTSVDLRLEPAAPEQTTP